MDPNIPAGAVQVQNLLKDIISLSVGLAFIVLVVVLTYAGVKFITSGGEPKGIQSASQAITWALLGMIFLIIGWIVLLLIEQFTGVKVTNFCLGFPGSGTGLNNCKW